MEPLTIGIIFLVLILIFVTTLIFLKFGLQQSSFDQACRKDSIKFVTDSQEKSTKNKNRTKKSKSVEKKDTNAAKGQHIIETKQPKSPHNITEKNPTSPKPPSPPVKSEATAKRIGIAEKTNDKGTTSTLANTITAHDEKKPKQISNTQSNKPDSSINAATNSNAAQNINLNMVVDKIKSVDGFGQEYSEFLSSYNEQVKLTERKYADEIKTLNADVNKHKGDLKEKDSRLKQAATIISDLQNEKSRLQSDIKEQKARYETFEQSVRPKLAEIVKLKEDNKKFHLLLQDSQSKALQSQQLITECNLLRSELEKASNYAKDEARNNHLSKSLADKLMNELNTAKHQLEEVISAKNSCELRIHTTQQELNTERERRLQETNQTSIQIDQLNKELDRLFNAYTALSKQQSFGSQELSQLQLDKDELLNNAKMVEHELSNWKNRCAELELKIEKSENEAVNISQISQQHEHEKNQNAALAHENSELRGKLKSYDTKLHQMEDQIKDASSRTTSDKAEIDKLTGTNRLLLQQIKSCEDKLNEQNRLANNHSSTDSHSNVDGLNRDTQRSSLLQGGSDNNCVDESSDIKHSPVFHFEWPVDDWCRDSPNEVFVTGTHWNWEEKLNPMEKTKNGFLFSLELTPDFLNSVKPPFLFKFVVDGNWRISSNFPRHIDEEGNENNLLTFDNYYKS